MDEVSSDESGGPSNDEIASFGIHDAVVRAARARCDGKTIACIGPSFRTIPS
jgi:hypothetical protein